jgi:hypothetical protein
VAVERLAVDSLP